MARKCKADADKTYESLLNSAETVFSQKGYAQATFQEIAKHAGLTRGAIYWHFDDKYQLLDAVLRRAELPWDRLPVCFTSLDEAPSMSELGQVISNTLQELMNTPRLHRVMLILMHRTELATDNSHVYGRLTEILDRVQTWLVAALSWHFQNTNTSPHRNIQAAATAVKALLTGMMYVWLLDQVEIDLAQLTQTVEMLIDRFVDITASRTDAPLPISAVVPPVPIERSAPH